MHELGIMQSTLELVEQQAQAHGARQVHRITLRIGVMAGVEVEALKFAFEVVTAGTLAAGARLDVQAVPARAHCKKCAVDFTPEPGPIFACPTCGEFAGELRQGRELELTQIEMT